MIPLACPFCAEQVASSSAGLWMLALLALPFAVAAVLVRVIRNLDA